MISSVRRLPSIQKWRREVRYPPALLFLIFMNALLALVTDRGRRLQISHGLRCRVQLHKRAVHRATEQEEHVGQFNLIGFVLFVVSARTNKRHHHWTICHFLHNLWEEHMRY